MIEQLFKKAIQKKVDQYTANTTTDLEIKVRAELTPKIKAEVVEAIEKERKFAWKNDCDFLFNYDGHDYFSYKNEQAIKLERFHRSGLELIALGRRLNHDELDKLVSCGEKSIEKIINIASTEKKIKHLEEISWVFREMKRRKEDLMFHNGVIIELLALNIIRDDEDPSIIDEALHNEKKELFNKKGGDIPFLVHASLKCFIPDIEALVENTKRTWEEHKNHLNISSQTYDKIYTELNS